MKKITQFLFAMAVLLCSAVAFSQSTISGTVVDGDISTPLPGVNIVEKGTNHGVSTDFDGNFSFETKSTNTVIVISYIGYLKKEITISGDTNLGEIVLESSEFGLDAVQIIASVAVDRKTPVAVSTIKSEQIQLKLGTQEFPEILKSTPGVYATKAGGGFGDGRINLRGFESENVAVLINGVPVNDMENGRVYWSNWAGLSDVTSSMQVQRGLGASKVAVPSIGGTINIISKTTDIEEGGSVETSIGNDGYLKFGATYSTGLMDNGFAATVSASKTDGDGYVDGTEFNAMSYFINISKEIGENHKLAFTAFGAQQRHGQRQNRQLISTYRASESGKRFNADWGYKNGQVTHQEDNFYHKPQISLNHYWDISDSAKLSTSVYASFGSGGGGGFSGVNKFGLGTNGVSDYRTGLYGPVDFDKIVDENEALGAQGSETILRASRNDHEWYGLLSTLDMKLTDNLVLTGGLDLRTYKGIHFTELTDLLGGQFYADDSNENNPNATYQVGDKILYHNDGLVNWIGLFGQLEYSYDALSAFVSVAGSNTGYKRIDYFNYLDSDPNQSTDWYNFLGYMTKGGANYNLNENHNVFANIGYFEKAGGFDAAFIGFDNENINPDAENQKIFSVEFGYGFRAEKLSANVNVYRTSWKDRTETYSFNQPDGSRATANILGVNAIHQGVELDFVYRATDNLRLTGMASLGDWRWDNDVKGVQIFDDEQNLIETVDLYIKDLRVGDAAQTTFALGANYDILERTTLMLDYNYYDNLYAYFDPSSRGTEGAGESWKVPAYGLFDLGLSHNFDMGPFDVRLLGRVNNVFNVEYISDANDGVGSTASTALVYYGAGRTFSVGAKFNF
ncbi:TonB-dependent receptor [Tamlana sp. s12]|uniref:TonB-dependent receptor n=1 Tax=Tamlana sp. s12 TaxID=1630406 RepID=UPI0007FC624A|nr:TonB-dependent receptor [Tamlana sp. s12]OBQ57187.1 TonB-dependent receptor [Tamlana sp. s12]QQY82629.1 TonB-dependent receptor [Tamlana sp. s12]